VIQRIELPPGVSEVVAIGVLLVAAVVGMVSVARGVPRGASLAGALGIAWGVPWGMNLAVALSLTLAVIAAGIGSATPTSGSLAVPTRGYTIPAVIGKAATLGVAGGVAIGAMLRLALT
jgi:hypothetical protein